MRLSGAGLPLTDSLFNGRLDLFAGDIVNAGIFLQPDIDLYAPAGGFSQADALPSQRGSRQALLQNGIDL